SAAGDLEQVGSTDQRALFTVAVLLAESAEYERAARVFERVNQLVPHSYEVLYNLGLSYYNLKKLSEAAEALAEAADLNPQPPETHFRLGLIASEHSDQENAVLEFKHATERAPDRAEYHYMLGREYLYSARSGARSVACLNSSTAF